MEEIDERIKEKLRIKKEIKKEKREISKLLNIRAYQIAKLIRELPKPKGLFRKKCPECGEQLWSGRLNSYYKYFVCNHCFYDYSKPVRFSLLNSVKDIASNGICSKEALDIISEGKEIISVKELHCRLAELKKKAQNLS